MKRKRKKSAWMKTKWNEWFQMKMKMKRTYVDIPGYAHHSQQNPKSTMLRNEERRKTKQNEMKHKYCKIMFTLLLSGPSSFQWYTQIPNSTKPMNVIHLIPWNTPFETLFTNKKQMKILMDMNIKWSRWWGMSMGCNLKRKMCKKA